MESVLTLTATQDKNNCLGLRLAQMTLGSSLTALAMARLTTEKNCSAITPINHRRRKACQKTDF